MNEPIEERYELWDRFLTRFPLETLESITLDDYTLVGSKDTFCWWIESGTYTFTQKMRIKRIMERQQDVIIRDI